jgi:hypothetical protein
MTNEHKKLNLGVMLLLSSLQVQVTLFASLKSCFMQWQELLSLQQF